MDVGRGAPEAVFRELMDLLWRGEVAGWADLVAEDVVMEFPFAPPGATRRLEGREAVLAYMARVPEVFEFGGEPETVVHQTTDPGRAVIEMGLRARVRATGRTYEQRYVVVLEVAGGRLTSYRDYWNPLVAQAAGVGV
jgi:ketosteroid isomerase-like protein